jgi:hypothetical protein
MARPGLVSRVTVTPTGTGHFTLRGASHLVTFTITGRRDGSALQAAGWIPVAFSTCGIKGPVGYPFLSSLANSGVAEFLIVLHQGDRPV